MTTPNFIQVHFLTPYSGALLNRDDTGSAKTLPYGDDLRTRVSSQCLKRSWRISDDDMALAKVPGVADGLRSRKLVSHILSGVADDAGDDERQLLESVLTEAIYGQKDPTKNTQVIYLGQPEIDFFRGEVIPLRALFVDPETSLASLSAEDKKFEKKVADNAKKAEKNRKTPVELLRAHWIGATKENLNAMRDRTAGAAGLTSAIFGRMITSDLFANIDAAVHVAHSFTVNAHDAEVDFFTAVDDLTSTDGPGAGTVQNTEINTGLYYGYLCIDTRTLLKNINPMGDVSSQIAADLVRHLIHLVATVTPGAKKGSTAPYSWANFMMVETGNTQPRSLSEAFVSPGSLDLDEAVSRLEENLVAFDRIYGKSTERRYFTKGTEGISSAESGTLQGLADFAAEQLGARAMAA